MEEKKEKRVVIKPMQVVFAILFAIAIVIGYLMALNGRYIKMDNSDVFDKWTEKAIYIYE